VMVLSAGPMHCDARHEHVGRGASKIGGVILTAGPSHCSYCVYHSADVGGEAYIVLCRVWKLWV
jgi:hypothetical protein